MKLEELSLRDLEWIVSLRSVHSLRDFARLKRVQVAHASKVFKKIEMILNQKLFLRSTKGIILTEEANVMIDGCERILDQTGFLQAHQKRTQRHTSVRITIGSYAFIQNFLTIEALLDFNPGSYHLNLIEMNPNNVDQFQLLNGVDVILHLGSIEWPISMQSTEIGKIDYGFYMGSQHYQKNIKLKEAYELPFIVPTYAESGHIRVGSDRCPIPKNLRIPGDGTSTAWQAIQLLNRQPQIAFLPKIAAKLAVKENRVKELFFKELPTIQEPLFMSVKTHLSQSFCKSLKSALIKALNQEEGRALCI